MTIQRGSIIFGVSNLIMGLAIGFSQTAVSEGDYIYRATFNNGSQAEISPDAKALDATLPSVAAKFGKGVLVGAGKRIAVALPSKSVPAEGTFLLWFSLKDTAKFRSDEIRLLDLKTGETGLLVYKPSGSERLYCVQRKGQNVESFSHPAYDWKADDNHCIEVSFGGGSPFFSVDGDMAGPAKGFKGAGGKANNELLIGDATAPLAVDEAYWFRRPLSTEQAVSLWKTMYLGQLAYETPLATVNRATKPPVIDGAIDPEEWKDATVLGGFVRLESGMLIREPIQVYATYDSKYFYVGLVSPIHNQVGCTTAAERDKLAQNPDQFEVFLVPYYTWSFDYFQLITEPAGSIYDGLCADPKWNGKWELKSKAANGAWTVEARLDCASFPQPTVPKAGEHWRFNACRTGLTPQFPLTQWSNSGNSYCNYQGFGTIRLAEKEPVVKLDQFLIDEKGTLKLSGGILPSAETVLSEMEVNLALYLKTSGTPGVPEWSENLRFSAAAPGQLAKFVLEKSLSDAKQGVLVLKVNDGKKTYYQQMVNFSVE